MRKLKLIEEVKEKELLKLKRELLTKEQTLLALLKEAERLSEEAENALSACQATAIELWLKVQDGLRKLREAKEKREAAKALEEELKELKEKAKKERAQLELLKNYRKKREREKERREEILFERFTYEVLNSRSS
jgi:hypothetical protein